MASVEAHNHNIPLIPLRDVVVFPHMVIPLFVGRKKSISALETAMTGNKQILLVTQKDAGDDDPELTGLHEIGTVSNILQLLKLPDGTVKVLVEGVRRAKIVKIAESDPFLMANVNFLSSEQLTEREQEVLYRSTVSQFENYVKLNKKIPSEILGTLEGIEDAGRLADTIAAHMLLKIEEKQKLLEKVDIRNRLEGLIAQIEAEIDLLQVDKRIRGRVKRQMEKSQREYYLNEQMKAIQKELGDTPEGQGELEALSEKIKDAKMTKEAEEKANNELKKLQMMSPMSAEATVVRSYIDWLVNVPWKKRSKLKLDLKNAQKILNEDHYGLEKVKDRIIEYLAVQQRVKKLKGSVLCLVGPPGVGKTSLGQSIAKATNRKYIRMSLGGVRDEAEIRGHRRTYIGSMPGKIMQKLSKGGTKNPLFLLDEIDKMAMDMRGDPSSAMLEVLDPEQNGAFNDHYLEVDYDLSEVMFICTSNSMNIPGPLLDRMEVIRLSGYTEDEKLNIAVKYLIPKQVKQTGLKEKEISITEEAVLGIIRNYTREAGVRGLEREISKICRKVVKHILLTDEKDKVEVNGENLSEYLGVQRFDFGKAEDEAKVGLVTGLAWTEVGGELLTIEAVATQGKGKTTFTGKLGEVMQESIKAAITVVRARSSALGIDAQFHEKNDIHIHVPEGATPKDGPSAGIGMCTALVSSLTNIPVRPEVAMTGEITLRGEVLPIGGLKEKILAAHRGGITTILIPDQNKKDLEEIPQNVLEGVTILPVKWIDEVLDVALAEPLEATADVGPAASEAESSKEKTSENDGDVSSVRHH